MGDEVKEEKIEVPDGIKPMFIQASSLEKYKMKTGEAISDTVPFKEFNVGEILEECVTLGFMSDFHGFMKDIAQYQVANGGPDNVELTILVVRDEEEKYGDNFYICLTMEAKERELNTAKQIEAEKQAAIAAQEAEEAARAAAEYARLNAVFVDEPMYARPYTSAFAEEVTHEHHPHAALNNVVVGGDRPLMLCRISRPRSSFSGKCPQFGPRDSDGDNKQVDYRPLKNPDFETQLSVRDIGLQAPNTTSSSATTQTPWFRPVNKGSQFNGFDADVSKPMIARKFKSSVVGISTNSTTLSKLSGNNGTPTVEMHSIGVGGSPEEESEEAKAQEAAKLAEQMSLLESFLTKARGPMEEALQQNETVEIFGDAFAQVGGEESGVGQKGDNDLKELRSFNDIKFSKNMSLACIDWHPSRRTMLAVSPVRNMTFYDRNASAGRPCPAHVLLWDFADLIHPQIMLEGPHEMLCFRFNRNPDQHDLVACGCVNGQIILFDVRKAMSKLNERDQSKGSNRAGGRRRETTDKEVSAVVASSSSADITATIAEIQPKEGEPIGIEPVSPYAVSSLEYSHRKSVFDLHWLAPDAQIDWRGNLLDEEYLDGKSYQFMTASGDGQCLVWDIRFAAIAAGDYPHILKVRTQGDKKKLSEGEQPPWLPLFRMELKRPGGAAGGDLLPARLTLLKQGHGIGSGTGGGLSLPGDEGTPAQDKKTDRRSMFMFGADSGELAFGDWRPVGGKLVSHQSKSTKEEEDGTGPDTPNYVSWVAHDHIRPAVSLEPSPFFPSLLLSVSDKYFTLWILGRKRPCFHSPPSNVSLTCGRWSQTRPGVLYTGRQDGTVDIWDLTDSSHKPSATVTVSSTRVTFMEFCDASATRGTGANRKPELLACGDAGGNLHVLEMPRNLCRASPHERNLMEGFVYREVRRVDYEGRGGGHKVSGLTDGDTSSQLIGDDGDGDSSPKPLPPAPNGDGELVVDPVQEALDAEEAAYQAMEDQFISQLGLKEEELPGHWKQARAVPPPPPTNKA